MRGTWTETWGNKSKKNIEQINNNILATGKDKTSGKKSEEQGVKERGHLQVFAGSLHKRREVVCQCGISRGQTIEGKSRMQCNGEQCHRKYLWVGAFRTQTLERLEKRREKAKVSLGLLESDFEAKGLAY